MPIQNDSHRAIPCMRRVRHFLCSRRGNIAAMTALLLVPLVAIMGMATQGGSWFLMERAMQNAADSAVIAAATNGGNGGTDYVTEAKSVAASYGFTDGANNVTITVPAPAKYGAVTSCASSPCYNVKIASVAPLYLLQLIGYKGNATTTGGGAGQAVNAGALATLKTVNAPFCLSALGNGKLKKGDAITANGVPKSSIGCNIQSAGNANCNGNNGLTSGWSDAVGTDTCGSRQHTITSVTDPYASLASSIPPVGTNCSNGYYPEGYVGSTKATSWPTSNNITAGFTLASVQYYCGDVEVSGGATVTLTGAAGGSVLVIENGALDVQAGTTLQASGVTIIFTSPSGSGDQYTACSGKKCSLSVSNDPTGAGNLDLSSPTSGTWSGMDIYQDPNLPEQSLTYTGNSPTWNLSGILYLPATDLTASGAVNKSTLGDSCFTLVVNSILINGTGNLFYLNAQTQCALQGVTSPTNAAYVIGELVY